LSVGPSTATGTSSGAPRSKRAFRASPRSTPPSRSSPRCGRARSRSTSRRSRSTARCRSRPRRPIDVKRLAILAVALASCVSTPGAPAGSAPAASPAPSRASPTALPASGLGALTKLADGTLVVSVPDCATTTQGGGITGCELLDAVADHDSFVGVLRWSDGNFEARSIDLATGEMRTLIPKEDLGIKLEDVRGDLAIFLETDERGGGNVHALLRRLPPRGGERIRHELRGRDRLDARDRGGPADGRDRSLDRHGSRPPD